MSTDRELLELAAKAAGYNTGHHWNAERLKLIPPVDSLVVILPDGQYHTAWNPLTDDADALRLAVALEIDLKFWDGDVEAGRQGWFGMEPLSDARRAIVRAAAEIGRAMP